MLVSGQAWALQGPVALGQASAAASRDPRGPQRQPTPCTASPAAAAHRDRRHNTEGGLDRVDPGADERGAADGRAPQPDDVNPPFGIGRRAAYVSGMTKPLTDVFTVACLNERWLVVAPSERSLAAGRAFDRSVVESGIGPGRARESLVQCAKFEPTSGPDLRK